jgi:hypothetical protein
MVRPDGKPAPGSIAWDPQVGFLDLAGLEGVGAIVHLAGESIASALDRRAQAPDPREPVKGTRLVAESVARLATRPSVLVCASAVGVYGPRGSEPLDETAAFGPGFLAEVCRTSGEAADPARDRRRPRRPHLASASSCRRRAARSRRWLLPSSSAWPERSAPASSP